MAAFRDGKTTSDLDDEGTDTVSEVAGGDADRLRRVVVGRPFFLKKGTVISGVDSIMIRAASMEVRVSGRAKVDREDGRNGQVVYFAIAFFGNYIALSTGESAPIILSNSHSEVTGKYLSQLPLRSRGQQHASSRWLCFPCESSLINAPRQPCAGTFRFKLAGG